MCQSPSFFPRRIRFTAEFTGVRMNFALMKLAHELRFTKELRFHDMQSLTFFIFQLPIILFVCPHILHKLLL